MQDVLGRVDFQDVHVDQLDAPVLHSQVDLVAGLPPYLLARGQRVVERELANDAPDGRRQQDCDGLVGVSGKEIKLNKYNNISFQ